MLRTAAPHQRLAGVQSWLPLLGRCRGTHGDTVVSLNTHLGVLARHFCSTVCRHSFRWWVAATADEAVLDAAASLQCLAGMAFILSLATILQKTFLRVNLFLLDGNHTTSKSAMELLTFILHHFRCTPTRYGSSCDAEERLLLVLRPLYSLLHVPLAHNSGCTS